MPKGIEIGVASETKAFKQGIESGVITPLEDAQRALQDLGDDKSPEQLERGLKDAQRATENLKDETRDTARAIEREYRDSYRQLGRSADDGFREAGRHSGEFKQEALQNFSEVTSSFSGQMTAVTDLAQGTLGGLAAGIAGPVGLAFGGAAVGVGLIGAAIESVGDKSEADQAKAAEWAQAYIEAGSKIITSTQAVASAQEIILDPDKYAEAKTAAENWGVSLGTAVLAFAGNQDALAEATAAVDAKGKIAVQSAQDAAAANRDLTKSEIEFNSAQAAGRGKLNELTASMQLGLEKADVYSETLRLLAENTEGATAKVDEFGDTVYSLPDGTTVYIDAETGQATQDTDAIANKIYSIQDKTVLVNLDTSSAQDQINALFANPYAVKVKFPSSPTYGVKVP
jgi:hypothetical protein